MWTLPRPPAGAASWLWQGGGDGSPHRSRSGYSSSGCQMSGEPVVAVEWSGSSTETVRPAAPASLRSTMIVGSGTAQLKIWAATSGSPAHESQAATGGAAPSGTMSATATNAAARALRTLMLTSFLFRGTGLVGNCTASLAVLL